MNFYIASAIAAAAVVFDVETTVRNLATGKAHEGNKILAWLISHLGSGRPAWYLIQTPLLGLVLVVDAAAFHASPMIPLAAAVAHAGAGIWNLYLHSKIA
jgi:hypothetical protein